MYQHKSGRQKRKERAEREKTEADSAKKQKTLFGYVFVPKKSNDSNSVDVSISEYMVLYNTLVIFLFLLKSRRN